MQPPFRLVSGACLLIRQFHSIQVTIAILGLLTFQSAAAVGSDKQAQPALATCPLAEADFDAASDAKALDHYHLAVSQLLKQGKFAELDCLSDAARTSKARFTGGAWKLRQLYFGLSTPRPGHPTQDDWKQHFDLIERWRTQNPQSITAPIVLAESYTSYAWDARGDGFANTVSESGWKLFADRLSKAREILDQAAPARCPDWYVAMQQIANGQDWKLDQQYDLLRQAIAFEPGYQYYYRILANSLQAKWGGEEGDPARFAEEYANRVGGDAGDILYFQIAENLVCGCEDPEFGHFSWPRLQKGYAALEKQYGMSMGSLNYFALMASKSEDWVAAEPAFQRIGENWSEDAWLTEDSFKQNRSAAAAGAAAQAHARSIQAEAEKNLKSQEGQDYRKEVAKKVAAYEPACLEEAQGDAHKAQFFLQVGQDGSARDGVTLRRPDHFTFCLMKALYVTFKNKETPFPVPPRDQYWVLLELDPEKLAASVK